MLQTRQASPNFAEANLTPARGGVPSRTCFRPGSSRDAPVFLLSGLFVEAALPPSPEGDGPRAEFLWARPFLRRAEDLKEVGCARDVFPERFPSCTVSESSPAGRR